MIKLIRNLLIADLVVRGADPAHVQESFFDDLLCFRRKPGILRFGTKVFIHLRKGILGHALFDRARPHLLFRRLCLLFLTLLLQTKILVVHPLGKHQCRLLLVKPGCGKHVLTDHLFQILQNLFPGLSGCACQLVDLQVFARPGDPSIFIIVFDQLLSFFAALDQNRAQYSQPERNNKACDSHCREEANR